MISDFWSALLATRSSVVQKIAATSTWSNLAVKLSQLNISENHILTDWSEGFNGSLGQISLQEQSQFQGANRSLRTST